MQKELVQLYFEPDEKNGQGEGAKDVISSTADFIDGVAASYDALDMTRESGVFRRRADEIRQKLASLEEGIEGEGAEG